MDWSWVRSLWSWKGRGGQEADRVAIADEEADAHENWERALVEAGIESDWADRLASRLVPLHRELGVGTSNVLLRAAVEIHALQAAERADVDRQVRDVREVERLLGAFSGELEKLDEVLEVLAAYAQRMRAQPAKRQRHTLH